MQPDKTRIIDLLRASGNQDLGAGLLRLAHLAAAMHRFELAQNADEAVAQGARSEVGRANGLARSSDVAAMLATDRCSDHTEVVW